MKGKINHESTKEEETAHAVIGSADAITPIHRAQITSYLKALHLPLGIVRIVL
jgi:hypothetical protein